MTVQAADEHALTHRVVHLTKTATVTPVCDTSAYAAGDLLFDAAELTSMARFTGGGGRIRGIALVDNDDQAAHTIDLLFYNATVDAGTLNSAPSASDGDSAKLIGSVRLTSADSHDMANNIVYDINDISFGYVCAATSLFVVGINVDGTPTQTASGIILRVWYEQD